MTQIGSLKTVEYLSTLTMNTLKARIEETPQAFEGCTDRSLNLTKRGHLCDLEKILAEPRPPY